MGEWQSPDSNPCLSNLKSRREPPVMRLEIWCPQEANKVQVGCPALRIPSRRFLAWGMWDEWAQDVCDGVIHGELEAKMEQTPPGVLHNCQKAQTRCDGATRGSNTQMMSEKSSRWDGTAPTPYILKKNKATETDPGQEKPR